MHVFLSSTYSFSHLALLLTAGQKKTRKNVICDAGDETLHFSLDMDCSLRVEQSDTLAHV